MATPTKIRIFVNWTTHKVVHSTAPIDHPNHLSLLSQGYKEVGEVKNADPSRVFWKTPFFDPQAKYHQTPQ